MGMRRSIFLCLELLFLSLGQFKPPGDPGLTLTFRRLIARERAKSIARPIPLRLKAFRKEKLAESTSVRALSTAGVHIAYTYIYYIRYTKKNPQVRVVDTKMKTHTHTERETRKMLDIFA